MKKSIEDLLVLQEVDLRIRALKIKLTAIPGERDKLVEEFEVVRKGLGAAKQAKLKVEQAIKQQSGTTESLREKQRALLVKSGTIKKMPEYNAVMSEIASMKQRISDSETREIELMDEQEAAEKSLAKAERAYRATGRTVQGEVRELDALKDTVIAEIREKEKLAELYAANVAQTLLGPYRRMLASGKGEPVGKLKDGHCSNCAIKNSPQTMLAASKGELVQCESCSFYLYDPNAKD